MCALLHADHKQPTWRGGERWGCGALSYICSSASSGRNGLRSSSYLHRLQVGEALPRSVPRSMTTGRTPTAIAIRANAFEVLSNNLKGGHGSAPSHGSVGQNRGPLSWSKSHLVLVLLVRHAY
eukprot:741270-Rhodomonas_salina.2